MKLTERLFAENEALWKSYLRHPFIQGMKDGSLDLKAFKYYMIQDYFYLQEYAKVFAIGISKSRTMEDLSFLTGAISNITWETDHVHTKYMARIGISEEELAQTRSALTNLAYTSYMIAKAHEGDVLNAYIAVLSCSWSYAFIGRLVNEECPNLAESNLYGEWVQAYSSEEYQTMNEGLMKLVDQKCAGLSEERMADLCGIFRICSEYEMKFWDMAYTVGKSDDFLLEN